MIPARQAAVDQPNGAATFMKTYAITTSDFGKVTDIHMCTMYYVMPVLKQAVSWCVLAGNTLLSDCEMPTWPRVTLV